MLRRAGRVEDHAGCQGAAPGPLPAESVLAGRADGSSDVRINGKKALRVGDLGNAHGPACGGSGPYVAYRGAPTVLVNGKLAHRADDSILHGGAMVPLEGGSSDVLIGGASSRVFALGGSEASCPIQGCPRAGVAPFCENYSIARRRLQQAFEYTCSANAIMAVLGRHDNGDPLARGTDERYYFSALYHEDPLLPRDDESGWVKPLIRQIGDFSDAVAEGTDYGPGRATKLGEKMPELLTALTGQAYGRTKRGLDAESMISYAAAAPTPVALGGFWHYITMLGVQGDGIVVHDSWSGIQRFIHRDCIPEKGKAPVPWNVHFQWKDAASTLSVIKVG